MDAETKKRKLSQVAFYHVRTNEWEFEDTKRLADELNINVSDLIRHAITEKKARIRLYNEMQRGEFKAPTQYI